MNVIILFLDSFRWDHVGIYHQGNAPFEGVKPCKTPNIDKFSEKCVIFENAYPEGLPTLPVRMQVMTGQATLPFRFWEPLKENDVTIQEILGRQGYVSALVTDTYHYRTPGNNYHRDFSCYRWIRGQEYDPWTSHPTKRNLDDYAKDNYSNMWRERVGQFLANTDGFTKEEDWFAAEVVEEACQWLKANRSHEKKLLWVDSFDPHEPWDPPKRFDTYTDPSYSGKRLILPLGGKMTDWATSEEINYIRGLYAGEAESVDYCMGKLFDCIETEGYLEDSFILLLADHGHPLGDHGKFLKGGDRMYSELLKAPFLVHLPGSENAGMRTDALVSFYDVLPTILELMNQRNNTGNMHGNSFLPVLKGDTNEHRSAVISGYFPSVDRCIRDKKWSYVKRPKGEPDELYDLENDPRETKNVADSHPEEVPRLLGFFGDYYFKKEEISEEDLGVQGQCEMGAASVD